MRVAAAKFKGEHDFRNFCKMDADNVHNYRREILSFDIIPCVEEWVIHCLLHYIIDFRQYVYLKFSLLFCLGTCEHGTSVICDKVIDCCAFFLAFWFYQN